MRSTAATLALILGGCVSEAVLDRTGSVVPDAPKGAAAQRARLPAEHERILAAYHGVYDDPRLEALVKQTVDKLVAASERPDQSYHVTILNSPAINAFALPSGQLYATRGLIALANDTSELASVLSHEMAHVIAQHAAIREDRARQVTLVTRVFDSLGTDPEMSALALAKSKIALASFSRAQEFEADGIGVGIAARAGYDPYGAVRFLTAMERNAELRPARVQTDGHGPDFLSSHPATPERIRNAQSNARAFTAPGSGERDRADYLASIDGMVYGEDPSEGFARGRRFLHPRLGFTFVAPEGFTLDNTAQAILGVKEGGGQALRLDVVRIPPDEPLTRYLASGWIDGLDSDSVQDVGISGFEAATATAKNDQWAFRLFAIRLGSDVYRFVFASKAMTPEADRAFRESASSFRRMSAQESNAAKALHLKVITVAAGDTVEQLASRMVVNDHPLERFRVLNGLGPNDHPKPGDRVKTVVE
jgi:predicted Zn-dependent protease